MTDNKSDDIGLEMIKRTNNETEIINDDNTHDDMEYPLTNANDYEVADIQQQVRDSHVSSRSSSLSLPPPPPPSLLALPHFHDESTYHPRRTLTLSKFLFEISALIVVFIFCMVLILAIRDNQDNLRITMEVWYLSMRNSYMMINLIFRLPSYTFILFLLSG